jgi:A1 cistron-splicing factor AAR2
VFGAYRLAVARPRLARALVEAVHAQLAYSDRYLEGEGVLDAMSAHARRLRRALTVYKSRLTEHLLALADRCSPDQQAVGRTFEALESWLWRLGWDLRDVGAAAAAASGGVSSRSVVSSGVGGVGGGGVGEGDGDGGGANSSSRDYVLRAGKYMLEDGEMVDVELEDDFESEDERGEFAAVVVDLDENGRPRDFVSV